MKFVLGAALVLLVVFGFLVAHGFFILPKTHQHRDNITDSGSGTPLPLSTPASPTPPESVDQAPQMYQAGKYSLLYDERQRAALVGFATNPNLEAARRADGWNRAGNWDEDFQRTKDTLNLDPSTRVVPAFQPPPFQPPFQLPLVQMPAPR